ncbi:MAG: hypothetical protein F9K29_16855 [Hyphomicrobiaceae bacterium]|nr:MAG: hypothetical protein F9K29_16855 [Hyphomicrobiaceae bacterium]
MKKMITVAALSMAIAAPAFAQGTTPTVTPPVAPAAKPVDAQKAQPTSSTQANQPAAKPTDTNAAVKQDASKKVDPKAAAPAGNSKPVAAPNANAPKVDATKTTEKPAETKKQ